MPPRTIEVQCNCGSRFQAAAALNGRRVTCPSCGEAFVARPVQRRATGLVVQCPCGGRYQAGLHLAGKIVACPRCGKSLRVPERPGESSELPAVQTPVQPVSVEEFWEDHVPEERVEAPRLSDAYRRGWKEQAVRSGERPAYVRYVLGVAAVLAVASMIWAGRQLYLVAEGVEGPVLGGLFGAVLWREQPVGDLFQVSLPAGATPREEERTEATFVGRMEGRRWTLRNSEGEYSVSLLQADRDHLPGSPDDAQLADIVARSILLSQGAGELKVRASAWRDKAAAEASGDYAQGDAQRFAQIRVVVLLDQVVVQRFTTLSKQKEEHRKSLERFFDSLAFR